MKGTLCRFYLCLWYKDVPKSQKKFKYYIARLKAKSIIRNSGATTSFLTRDAIKKITLALGLKSSFSRGFDKILNMLLVSERFCVHPFFLSFHLYSKCVNFFRLV